MMSTCPINAGFVSSDLAEVHFIAMDTGWQYLLLDNYSYYCAFLLNSNILNSKRNLSGIFNKELCVIPPRSGKSKRTIERERKRKKGKGVKGKQYGSKGSDRERSMGQGANRLLRWPLCLFKPSLASVLDHALPPLPLGRRHLSCSLMAAQPSPHCLNH